MRVIEFVAELHGNKETSLNGRRIDDAEEHIDERAIFNQMSLDHQWKLLSHLRKLLNRMEHTYQKSRVKNGEVSIDDYDTFLRASRTQSGMTGVRGTPLASLEQPI